MSRLRILALLGLFALAALAAPRRSAGEPRWWKGNTHTHTLWSDGDGAPELVADWYSRHGYHFLVLSDHNVLSVGERWVPVSDLGVLKPERVDELVARFGAEAVELRASADGREMRLSTLDELRARFERPDEFLFIQGEELTDSFERAPVHLNGLNLAELIPPQGGASLRETLQRNIDAVIAQGERLKRPVLAHINHPNFGWALTAEDIAHVRGERFFEVYNGHAGVRNHGDAEHMSTERMWDVALTLRLSELELGLLYGLATDDAHGYHAFGLGKHNPGRGWVMVRAEELSPESLIEALRRGDFYASSGVELEEIVADDAGLSVSIAPQPDIGFTTLFIGTRRSEAGSAEVGEVLLETSANPARYEFRGDELYVRAKVVSSRPHPNPYAAGDMECAWVQPVVPTPR
jgi:hypothetical protein